MENISFVQTEAKSWHSGYSQIRKGKFNFDTQT